jgi:hypothetical protein
MVRLSLDCGSGCAWTKTATTWGELQRLWECLWTFARVEGRGGRPAGVLYSGTGACRHNDIDAFVYLKDILRRLRCQPPGRLDELLPRARRRWRPVRAWMAIPLREQRRNPLRGVRSSQRLRADLT